MIIRWLLLATVVNGFLLPEQDHIAREHFFGVIYVTDGSQNGTEYTSYSTIDRESGSVDFSDIFAFERPCDRTVDFKEILAENIFDVKIAILVPCYFQNVTFSEILEENPLWREFNCSTNYRLGGIEYVEIELNDTDAEEIHRMYTFPSLANLSSSVALSLLDEYPDSYPIVRLSYWTDKCANKCGTPNTTDTILKNSRCQSVRKKTKQGRRQKGFLVCDFEKECDWKFVSPGLGHRENETQLNFQLARQDGFDPFPLMVMPMEPRPPAMIVSPYYSQTSHKCSIQFSAQLSGDRKRGFIVITTQHRPIHHGERSGDEYEEWTTPIQHAVLDVDSTYRNPSPIHLGHFSHPTRIRIECHNALHGENTSTSSNVECVVKDIYLVECDERVSFGETCSSRDGMFICSELGHRKCIKWDKVCDGHRDCPGGEDEKECAFSVPGSFCGFETSDRICPGWIEETSIKNEPMNDAHLMFKANYTLAKIDFPTANIPMYDRTLGAEGHFMWTSKALMDQYDSRYLISRLWSPVFPPTMRHETGSKLADICFLRFWYCYYSNYVLPILKIETVSGLNSRVSMRLQWEFERSPVVTSPTHCSWTRASIRIPEQKTPFQLIFTLTPILSEYVVLSLDDISLSPNCFPQDNILASSYQFTTCGVSGPYPPNSEKCKRHLMTTNPNISAAMIPNVEDGAQLWVAPITSEYRIELCGAAGGYMPGSTIENGGGCIFALMKIKKYDSVTVVLGQRGESPCTKYNNTTDPAWLSVCSSTPHSFIGIDHSIVPGSGGGGASRLMLPRDNPIMVAGGGGGLFTGVAVEDIKMALGGRPSETRVRREAKQWTGGDGIDPMLTEAGYGGSFTSSGKENYDKNCAICALMSGKLNKSEGGKCGSSRRWRISGGFGGGGASCGAGGGGGAGYEGGRPGYQGPGEGGTSWVDPSIIGNIKFDYAAGFSFGDGYVSFHPCILNCPLNSTCHFVHPRDYTAECRCQDGRVVDREGSCEAENISIAIVQTIPDSTSTLLLLAWTIAITIVACGVYCCIQRVCTHFGRKKRKFDELAMGKLRVTQEENTFYSQMGSYTEEYAELHEDIHQIERTNIILKDPLGMGAFGEVYAADWAENGKVKKVAVKTLINDGKRNFHDEFVMEANVMNKFRHENIITLYGVNFDKTPHYLVIELMKGGDLRWFLKSSRPNVNHPNPNELLMGDLINMAFDVARGCEFLEANKFIHRDIAGRNCLLSHSGPGRVVKIGDFGMARDIYTMEYYRKGGRAMLPVRWMPPEAFLDGFFSSKTDVWSFGILMWEIFSLGYMPYPGKTNVEVMDLISRGARMCAPPGAPLQMHKVMLQCWKTDLKARPSFETVVRWLVQALQDVNLCHLPLPDRTISVPPAQLTSLAGTPRSDITMLTDISTPADDDRADGPLLFHPRGYGLDVALDACTPYEPKTELGNMLSRDVTMENQNRIDDDEEQWDQIEPSSRARSLLDGLHLSATATPSNSISSHCISRDTNDNPRYIMRMNSIDIDDQPPLPPPRRPTTLNTGTLYSLHNST